MCFCCLLKSFVLSYKLFSTRLYGMDKESLRHIAHIYT